MKFIIGILNLTMILHCGSAIAADLSLGLTAVQHKSDFFEAFQQQRELLFTVGFPGATTDINQIKDENSDSFILTGGYHYNRYFSIKASYLAKSEYSLKSDFTYEIPDNNGNRMRTITGNDSIKSKVRGASVGLYGELPIREKIFIGSNIGVLISRVITERKIQAQVDSYTDDTIINSDTVSKNKHHTYYDINPVIGLHAGFKYSEAWHINLQWNRYFSLGHNENYPGVVDLEGNIVDIKMSNETHIDSYSLGLSYLF